MMMEQMNKNQEKTDEKFKNKIQRQNCNIDQVDKLDRNKNKVSGVENYDNINKSMMLENDCVNRSSNNEVLWGIEYNNDGMIVCVKGWKRVCRESIIVKDLQGVDFSLNGVFVGDVHVLRKDESAFDLSLIHI